MAHTLEFISSPLLLSSIIIIWDTQVYLIYMKVDTYTHYFQNQFKKKEAKNTHFLCASKEV